VSFVPERVARSVPRARVFCCPYAGGSSLAYLNWIGLDSEIDVVRLDYPGRLVKQDGPMLRSVDELASHLYDEISAILDLPFALVGSSLGGLVAFELARMAEAHGRSPAMLIVCACPAPDRLSSREKLSQFEDDDDFLSGIASQYGDAISAVAKDPESREVFLPVIRADIEAFDSYRLNSAQPIACDLLAVRGESDKAVRFADMAAWLRYSKGLANLLSVPGDHFFIEKCPSVIAKELRTRMKCSPA
jgi:surfactin synthase thioesterase subunit